MKRVICIWTENGKEKWDTVSRDPLNERAANEVVSHMELNQNSESKANGEKFVIISEAKYQQKLKEDGE